MAYLASQLISRSWYLSGILARDLQTEQGSQSSDGLYLLNALLDYKQIEIDLVPYWTYVEFPLIPNQEFYYLPNISAIETATFNIDVLRYPMDMTTRRSYYASGRVDNINTLPFNWHYNRGQGGGTFACYFLPASNYPLKLMAKFFLTDVTLDTDLTTVFAPLTNGFISNISVISGGSGYTSTPTVTITGLGTGASAYASIQNGQVTNINLVNAGSGYSQIPTVTITGGGGVNATAQATITSYNFLQTNNAGLDTSYIEYLRYALAQYMCSEYGILFNPESEKILKKLERKLMWVSPPDLSVIKTTVLTSGNYGLSYADVNLGRGWRPS